MEKARAIATMLLAATAFAGTPAIAQQGTESKGATANTERANAAVRQAMTMNDKQDFEDATRGLMAQLQGSDRQGRRRPRGLEHPTL